jgi:Sigma-70, region 4
MSHDDADRSLDELARRAAEGDREALSALVRDLQHPMYRLALRFLGHPDDAQDACQEILIRIVTRLGMLLCLSRPQRAAYLLADVLGLTDSDGAEILSCSRAAFRQRVSRARRTLRQVIDNRAVSSTRPTRAAAAASSPAARPPASCAAITCRSLAIPASRCGHGSNPSPSSSTPLSPSVISTASTASPPPPGCGRSCRPGSPTC